MNSTNNTTKNTADKPTTSLKQILERSKLANSKILQQELPPIERGLNQIDSQTQKLSAKTATSDEKTDIRAHYFLAQGGVNTQVLIKELGTIHLGGLEEHRQPIQDTDVEGYLEQQNTETVMKVLHEGRQEVVSNMNTRFEEDVDNYWNDFIKRTAKVNPTQGSSFKLSKAKFDQSRVVSAGSIH
ncbi:hypothetical protein MBANPS3_001662 [Mucor bainieri]